MRTRRGASPIDDRDWSGRSRPAPEPLSRRQARLRHLHATVGNRNVCRMVDGHEAGSQVGLAGGPVPDAIEEVIGRARGRGSALANPVRRSMEGALGADLGDVRLHTGPGADELNRSLQSRAFTVGNDIYFSRGQYQPSTEGGRRLLAHELVHTQQQAAGGGVARSVIQRKVGFELETAMQTVAIKKKTSDKTLGKKQGKDSNFQTRDYMKKNQPLQGRERTFNAMKKMEPVLNTRNDPWTAEADEDVGSGKSYLEYVTQPFDDTSDGATKAAAALGTIARMHHWLVNQANQHGAAVVRSQDLQGFGAPKANTGILTSTDGNAQLQASVGVRLDRVADLMMQMGGKQEGEHEDVTKLFAEGREVIGKGLQSPAFGDVTDATANLTGAAPQFAFRAVDKLQDDVESDLAGIGATNESLEKLVSIVALAVQYILGAPNVTMYAKTMAPLMARTDFVGMFNQLHQDDQDLLRANNGEPFVQLVLEACSYRGGPVPRNRSVVPQVYTDTRMDRARKKKYVKSDMLAGLTINRWLTGITAGTDYLTKANFRQASKETQKSSKGSEQHLESLGHLGGLTNPVGEDRVAGTVFEIRTLRKVPYGAWFSELMNIFNYIYDLNSGEPAVLQDAFGRLSKSDSGLFAKLISDDPAKFKEALETLEEAMEDTIDKKFG